jgi:hypothetical protein
MPGMPNWQSTAALTWPGIFFNFVNLGVRGGTGGRRGERSHPGARCGQGAEGGRVQFTVHIF